MSKNRRRTNIEADKGKEDFLARLREKGISLPEEDLVFLQEHGHLQVGIPASEDSEEIQISLKFNPSHESISRTEAMCDKMIVIIEPSVKRKDEVVIVSTAAYKTILQTSVVHYGYASEITRSDWTPESVEHHSDDFWQWINSINEPDGFWNSKHYYKFNLYVQQAMQWERHFQTTEDNRSYRYSELEKMSQNSLYALNRYLELKEAAKSGVNRYTGNKAHQIILYLMDCGYSIDCAKARQIAFTTTMCGWSLVKTMLNAEVQIKYISENEVKAKRTFSDKVKWPFGRFPKWARPKVANDPQDFIIFGEKNEKGVLEGNNSIFEILPPTKTAVASSSPTVTLIDEAGQIPILQDMLSDIEPTMRGYNPRTGRQELLRQCVIWGTGGYMTGPAGIAFKSVYMSHYEAWMAKADTPFVPLVLNVWYRPGWTQEDQERERKKAYSITGPERETAITRFHQSYPETLDDIFKMSGNTLVSEEWIHERLKVIREKGAETNVAQYGYFEPIYDFASPAHEGSDVPYKITGAVFVRCEKTDSRVSTIILDDRRPWRNRYFKGTDPIASDSGMSDMSSTIWDAYWSTPVALMVFRSQDYRQAYLQSFLLGVYYDVEGINGAVPELVEANIGTAYREYVGNKGCERTLVLESELPQIYQTARNSVRVGVDNKGLRNRAIITELKNIFLTYGSQIWIPTYFVQLKTFVEKSKGNTTTWEPVDKRVNRDDALFSLVYSYICALCYSHKRPEPIDTKPESRIKYVSKLVRGADGQLRRVSVKKQDNHIRKELTNNA